jgi:predicted Rossmann-fold nucleotide-binding protein
VSGGTGTLVLPPFDHLPFDVYRAELYGYDELVATEADGTTLDERIGAWFRSSTAELEDGVVRALHDATIDAAVARFVRDRRMVGVMGGHAVGRDADLYRAVAELGRALTRNGWCVATGGGPGVMEAANLGAWFASRHDDALLAALDVLAAAPSFSSDRAAHRQAALEVRSRWPGGDESLGVPTWVYLDEPTSAFATSIAKYFTNSVREDGLLALARSGVVYAPGGAGTVQEIFTDAAQNSLTLYDVRSPVVFFDRRRFEAEQPEVVAAVRRQAAAFGWDDLVALADEPDEVVAFLRATDPDRSGTAGIVRGRRRRA